MAETSDLAERATVSIEDLAGRTVMHPGPGTPDYWIEAMLPASTPSGQPIPRGPRTRTFHEVLAVIAAGHIVSTLNAHVNRYYTYPGVVYLPMPDAPPTEWALIWRTDRQTALIHAFAELARDHGGRRVPGRESAHHDLR